VQTIILMSKEYRLYNTDRLHEIGDGDAGFIKEVIEVFLQNLPANANSLVQACMDQEWQSVYFIAHKMKASIDLMGIEKLMQEIRTIEQWAKSNTNFDQIAEKVNLVNEIIHKTAALMKEDFNL